MPEMAVSMSGGKPGWRIARPGEEVWERQKGYVIGPWQLVLLVGILGAAAGAYAYYNFGCPILGCAGKTCTESVAKVRPFSQYSHQELSQLGLGTPPLTTPHW